MKISFTATVSDIMSAINISGGREDENWDDRSGLFNRVTYRLYVLRNVSHDVFNRQVNRCVLNV